MRTVFYWISLGSIFCGYVLRASSQSLGWEQVSAFQRTLRPEKVALYDQTGIMLMVFGFLLALMVAYFYLKEEGE
jgi:hypothetical protein